MLGGWQRSPILSYGVVYHTPERKRKVLPETRSLYYRDPYKSEGEEVEFRLIYYGPLPSESSHHSRITEKHNIRKFLHPQLKEWWQQNILRMGSAEAAAQNHDQFGFHFVPIVSKRKSENCAVNILFLRRDAPGNLIKSGGDIDNRMKVLFDGLRMPREHQEVGEATPGDAETPFFCLLEDDSLITEVHIVTDRLLLPVGNTEDSHRQQDVELIIHVKTDQDVARASDVEDAVNRARVDTMQAAFPHGPRYSEELTGLSLSSFLPR